MDYSYYYHRSPPSYSPLYWSELSYHANHSSQGQAASGYSNQEGQVASGNREGQATSGRHSSQVQSSTNGSQQIDQTGPIKFCYMVKIFNPKKKSDFTVRMWHDAQEVFTSVTALKLQLKDSFQDELPCNTSFAVGYFEGKSHVKRWIVDNRDLERMYSIFEPESTINLWCEGRSTFGHSGNDRTRDEPAREEPPAKKSKTTKREQIEEEVESIVTKLKNKHPEMATPKIRLWAKLIQTGRYEDMDTPPRYTTYYRCTSSCKAKKRRCC